MLFELHGFFGRTPAIGRVCIAAAGIIAAGAATEALSQSGETYFGTVRASDLVSLSYAARGCILQTNEAVKNARVAEAGQVLVTLDAERSELSLRTAEARVAELAATVEERQLSIQAAIADDRRKQEDLAFVEKEFERNKTMLGRGLINETALEAIERRFMEARFASERAKEAIANAGAAKKRAEIALEIGMLDARTAEITLTGFSLAAPFDGVLVGFEASVGDCVQEGALAAQIYRPDQKSVDVFLPISRLAAPDASGLAVGAAVSVSRVNGDECGGAITRLDTQADPETQFVEATVDLAEDCAPGFFLNESVEIRATGESG